MAKIAEELQHAQCRTNNRLAIVRLGHISQFLLLCRPAMKVLRRRERVDKLIQGGSQL